MRRDLEQLVARHRTDPRWSAVALIALLDALIHDLDNGWSGIEVHDAWAGSADDFSITYRARYLSGLLGIPGHRAQRGAYLQHVETPERFGSYFELYVTEPSGSDSFTEPDEHGVKWFVDFGETGE